MSEIDIADNFSVNNLRRSYKKWVNKIAEDDDSDDDQENVVTSFKIDKRNENGNKTRVDRVQSLHTYCFVLRDNSTALTNTGIIGRKGSKKEIINRVLKYLIEYVDQICARQSHSRGYDDDNDLSFTLREFGGTVV
uniref:Uncharacterized protein n=1 Tax=Glossina pallidipes TaxID=7398 RepID=A0A1A9Z5Q5_GLOPL